MASLFEPTPTRHHGGSTPSSSAPPALSLADQLPNTNFGFDDLRERMAKFTVRFDAFIDAGRKRVLEERSRFHLSMAELSEDQRMKAKSIDVAQLKTNTHQHTVAKEAAEAREMQQAVRALSEQRDRQQAVRDGLLAQIEETQREIEKRLAAQKEHARKKEAMGRFNVPELDFWVSNLCVRIEGAGQDDRLKFVYTHVDEKDWDREAWFELSTAGRAYDVRHCRPKLERSKVERVLDRTNETRELAVLLKGMRELFVEAMKS
ncbi:Ribose-phosphate pyrophosphokinase [Pyricularia oryzae]|nr:Ribose-phosphate pyrophosphokinase [Pyricularia oryzae]